MDDEAEYVEYFLATDLSYDTVIDSVTRTAKLVAPLRLRSDPTKVVRRETHVTW